MGDEQTKSSSDSHLNRDPSRSKKKPEIHADVTDVESKNGRTRIMVNGAGQPMYRYCIDVRDNAYELDYLMEYAGVTSKEDLEGTKIPMYTNTADMGSRSTIYLMVSKDNSLLGSCKFKTLTAARAIQERITETERLTGKEQPKNPVQDSPVWSMFMSFLGLTLMLQFALITLRSPELSPYNPLVWFLILGLMGVFIASLGVLVLNLARGPSQSLLDKLMYSLRYSAVPIGADRYRP